jgi:hypothetical protein
MADRLAHADVYRARGLEGSLFQLKDEPEGSGLAVFWKAPFVRDFISSRGGRNVGIGIFDFHISSACFVLVFMPWF